jgi:hypothetical protein
MTDFLFLFRFRFLSPFSVLLLVLAKEYIGDSSNNMVLKVDQTQRRENK